MKYIIMADGDGKRWNNYLGVPKHLVEINGEPLLARTTRLLKENGITNYVITTRDERYGQYGETIPQSKRDCEVDRFEEFSKPVCYLYGDVYYTEYAIKTIVNTETDDILFFGSEWEIFAIKVNNIENFYKHKNKIKELFLRGDVSRCIGWEVYKSIHNLSLDEHNITSDYIKILDGTDDIDYPQDYEAFKRKIEEPNKLSIIIPCHNLEKFITPCLNSLLEQENKANLEREIIFICDNCIDKTHKIIEKKMKKSQYEYHIIDTSVGSPGYARNIGLDHATGKYIWFIDGDDWLTTPVALDVVTECMIKDDMDIVEFKIKSNAHPEGKFGGGTVWRAMLSKRIIGDTRFNDRQNGEDNDFCDIVWNNPNAKYGRISLAPYFYNFPREGSQSDIAYHTFKKEG